MICFVGKIIYLIVFGPLHFFDPCWHNLPLKKNILAYGGRLSSKSC